MDDASIKIDNASAATWCLYGIQTEILKSSSRRPSFATNEDEGIADLELDRNSEYEIHYPENFDHVIDFETLTSLVSTLTTLYRIGVIKYNTLPAPLAVSTTDKDLNFNDNGKGKAVQLNLWQIGAKMSTQLINHPSLQVTLPTSPTQSPPTPIVPYDSPVTSHAYMHERGKISRSNTLEPPTLPYLPLTKKTRFKRSIHIHLNYLLALYHHSKLSNPNPLESDITEATQHWERCLEIAKLPGGTGDKEADELVIKAKKRLEHLYHHHPISNPSVPNPPAHSPHLPHPSAPSPHLEVSEPINISITTSTELLNPLHPESDVAFSPHNVKQLPDGNQNREFIKGELDKFSTKPTSKPSVSRTSTSKSNTSTKNDTITKPKESKDETKVKSKREKKKFHLDGGPTTPPPSPTAHTRSQPSYATLPRNFFSTISSPSKFLFRYSKIFPTSRSSASLSLSDETVGIAASPLSSRASTTSLIAQRDLKSTRSASSIASLPHLPIKRFSTLRPSALRQMSLASFSNLSPPSATSALVQILEADMNYQDLQLDDSDGESLADEDLQRLPGSTSTVRVIKPSEDTILLDNDLVNSPTVSSDSGQDLQEGTSRDAHTVSLPRGLNFPPLPLSVLPPPPPTPTSGRDSPLGSTNRKRSNLPVELDPLLAALEAASRVNVKSRCAVCKQSGVNVSFSPNLCGITF